MIGFRVTNIELDSDLVVQTTRETGFRGLMRFGYRCQSDAKQSLVRGRGPSQPGKPPHNRTGAIKNFIRYAMDRSSKSVVIGPEYLQRKSKYAVQALEGGGVSISAKGRPIHVAARPFMGPAFDRTILSSVPSVFANSVQ